MIYQNFNLIPYLSPVENIEVALDITHNQRLAAEADERYEIDQEKKQIVRHE